MSPGAGLLPVVLAAAAGGLAVLAAREGLAATPVALAWVRSALEPLRRASREGRDPTRPELRRLGLLGAGAAVLAGWFLAGPAAGCALALAAPTLAASAARRGAHRYRRRVEAALPQIAGSVADSLAAGRSLRGALALAADSLDGPAAGELARLGAELELGAPTEAALEALRRRLRSERVDALCAALLSQRVSGGDLAGLLRGFARASAEREEAMREARTATAQARFTGLLVVAMPAGAALFAEALEPGFLGRLASSPAALALTAAAAALQLAGFAAIRRLSRIPW
ncbi:MAG: type II secretion system F family protein [Solirubrobacterales bacterium]